MKKLLLLLITLVGFGTMINASDKKDDHDKLTATTDTITERVDLLLKDKTNTYYVIKDITDSIQNFLDYAVEKKLKMDDDFNDHFLKLNGWLSDYQKMSNLSSKIDQQQQSYAKSKDSAHKKFMAQEIDKTDKLGDRLLSNISKTYKNLVKEVEFLSKRVDKNNGTFVKYTKRYGATLLFTYAYNIFRLFDQMLVYALESGDPILKEKELKEEQEKVEKARKKIQSILESKN